MNNIKKDILIRVRIASLGVGFFALCIAMQIGNIQWLQGEEWRKMEEETTFDYKKVKATRGNILSDNGSLLATSLPFYKVAVDPTLAKEEVFKKGIDSLSYLLARFYGDKSALDYKRMLKDARSLGKQYIIINRKLINFHQKKAMKNWPVFREGRYRGGVVFEKIDLRYNPFSDLSRRTIGFVNAHRKGAGLEYGFDKELHGQDGEALFQKIAGATWKLVFDGNHVKAIDGYDIETTLDVNLQDVAETSLYKAMVSHRADEGTVVVMEVKTGHVKAISNLTGNGLGSYEEKYNLAVGGSYEPGSTFKLAAMMALLEETDLRLKDTVNTGNGEYVLYHHKVRDHKEGGYGKLTVQRAFEVSSNIAMARLVNKYYGTQPQKFIRFLDQIKITEPLHLQIPGEALPKITRPSDKRWSGITLPWMAYGYGFEISPLQTLTLYNAVANRGKMIKPLFVKSIRCADQVIKVYDTEVVADKICSDRTLMQLNELLEGVVENGTAKNLDNLHYRIAGKTGTAQMLTEGRYEKKYITSFVGYFPAHDPKYSAIVLIKNPKGISQFGTSVAGPVFKDIADNIYARDINIHPAMEKKRPPMGVFPTISAGRQEDLAMLANELGISNHALSDEEWVKAAAIGNSVHWKKNPMVYEHVPDVKGMTFRDAIYLLENVGLRVSYNGKGRVVNQSLTPGTKVSKGNIIYIELS